MTRSDRPALRVKFQAKGHRAGDDGLWLRQFPGQRPVWGRCTFLLDPEVTAYDWLVVYDDLAPAGLERFSERTERLPCARANTLLVTAEPSSVKVYGKAFTDQFGWVLTSQEPWALDHPRAVRGQTGYRWFYGKDAAPPLTFDDLAAAPPPAKREGLSTLCSSKAQRHTLHARRLAFTRALAATLPELVWFGRGVRPIGDKAEAIDPFRVHLVVENHRAPHHFTEKVSDAFLGRALLAYHGAPDLADYFPAESFFPIDLDAPDAAAERLRSMTDPAIYEARRPAIEEARRRVLQEYNLFATLARFIEERHEARGAGGELIHGRHRARRMRPLGRLAYALEKRRVRRRQARV